MRIKKDGSVFRLELSSSSSEFETRISFAVDSHDQMRRPRIEVSPLGLVHIVMEGLANLSAIDFPVPRNWLPQDRERMPRLIAKFLSEASTIPEMREVMESVDSRFTAWFDYEIIDELNKYTHAVQCSPNCPSPFCIRLVRPGTGRLDYGESSNTHDLLGYGKTLAQAAANALENAESS